MKKIFLLISCILLILTIQLSCNSNQETPSPDNILIGTWNAISQHDSIYYKQSGQIEVRDTMYTALYARYTFRTDNTYNAIDSTGVPGFVRDFSYQLENNKIYTSYQGIPYDSATISISGNHFTLFYIHANNSDYYSDELTTFQKQ